MKEFRAAIREGDITYRFYYTPFTYNDWSAIAQSEHKYDDATIRYVLNKYVYLIVTDSNEDVDTEHILTLPPVFKEKLIDILHNRSGFGAEEFITSVERFEHQSRKLIGAYDYFIFLHTDPATYMMLLECDTWKRAQFISVLEQHTGINVKQRFEESVTTNSPLDLVNNDDQYNREKQKEQKRNRHHSLFRNPHENTSGDDLTAQMIEQSRQMLEQDLKRHQGQKQVTRKPFDWGKDNADMIDTFGEFSSGNEI